MRVKFASIIIVTYNCETYISPCLTSIARQKFPHEIIVVDNGSSDKTADIVSGQYPEVILIKNEKNRGYGAGNNQGVNTAKGQYVVIINPDVTVAPDWLEQLITPLQGELKKIVTPKILVYDGSVVNTCGNINCFTGLTFTRGLGSDPDSDFITETRVSGVSGACFALLRESYLDIGGFDELFFLYNEDSDFSWRANILGYSIFFTPQSIIYHDYHLNISPSKIFHLEFGRYVILKKYYSCSDLFVISPSLLLAEILTLGFCTRLGRKGLKNKISAMIEGFTIDIAPVHGDKPALISQLCPTIPLDQLTGNKCDFWVKKIMNALFRWNYKLLTHGTRISQINTIEKK